MSIRGLLFQWASTIKIQLRVLVLYKADLIINSLKINLFSPWYSWKNCWVDVKQQSFTHLFKHLQRSDWLIKGSSTNIVHLTKQMFSFYCSLLSAILSNKVYEDHVYGQAYYKLHDVHHISMSYWYLHNYVMCSCTSNIRTFTFTYDYITDWNMLV